MAFNIVHIDIKWRGEGLEEVGYHACKTGQGDLGEKDKILVRVSKKYFRPAEVETLLGDYSKAKNELGWNPEINIETLIHEMVQNDLKNI